MFIGAARRRVRSSMGSPFREDPQDDRDDQQAAIEVGARMAERMEDRDPPMMEVAPTSGVRHRAREVARVPRLAAGLAEAAVAPRNLQALEEGGILLPQAALAAPGVVGVGWIQAQVLRAGWIPNGKVSPPEAVTIPPLRAAAVRKFDPADIPCPWPSSPPVLRRDPGPGVPPRQGGVGPRPPSRGCRP